MNKNDINKILWIFIAILLGILAIKFLILTLPIVLIILCTKYIYNQFKKNKKTVMKKQNKEKTIKIIEMVED